VSIFSPELISCFAGSSRRAAADLISASCDRRRCRLDFSRRLNNPVLPVDFDAADSNALACEQTPFFESPLNRVMISMTALARRIGLLWGRVLSCESFGFGPAPEALDDYVTDTHPVRVVDVFVDELDLRMLGFESLEPALTGRPSYRPEVMLKIYIYEYLNRIQSSRRLEREARRNVELMWLTGRLAPDFKTIARFRKDNGKAIRRVCRQFVVVCQRLNLFAEAIVAIDGSKFKAVSQESI
jgi:transposase